MHIYWTSADTLAALIAGGGSIVGLHLGQIAERLLALRNG